MRRLALVLLLCCCGCCATAAVGARADAAEPTPARGKAAAACAGKTPVKRAATAAVTRRTRKAAKRAAKARRRACAQRRKTPARPVAGQPAAPGATAGTPAPAAAQQPAPAPPAGAPAAPADPGASPLPVTSTIGVDAYDFGTFVLRLTRTSVPAGNLTIYFRNHDVSDHNLWLDAPDPEAGARQISDDVGEGGGATKTVAVTAGTWRLYCSLPGHGTMNRTLAVN